LVGNLNKIGEHTYFNVLGQVWEEHPLANKLECRSNYLVRGNPRRGHLGQDGQ